MNISLRLWPIVAVIVAVVVVAVAVILVVDLIVDDDCVEGCSEAGASYTHNPANPYGEFALYELSAQPYNAWGQSFTPSNSYTLCTVCVWLTVAPEGSAAGVDVAIKDGPLPSDNVLAEAAISIPADPGLLGDDPGAFTASQFCTGIGPIDVAEGTEYWLRVDSADDNIGWAYDHFVCLDENNQWRPECNDEPDPPYYGGDPYYSALVIEGSQGGGDVTFGGQAAYPWFDFLFETQAYLYCGAN